MLSQGRRLNAKTPLGVVGQPSGVCIVDGWRRNDKKPI
jgi:hypothetical protein